MRVLLVLCLAAAGLAACGVKDDPVPPQRAAEFDPAVEPNEGQGLLE